MFGAGMFAAGTDGFVQWIISTRRAKFDAIILAETRDGGIVQNNLGHGRQFDHIQLFDGPLRSWIEPAGAIQYVTEQI